jgi:hypothetical protein
MVRMLISYGISSGVIREIAFDFFPSISLLLTIMTAGALLLGISLDSGGAPGDETLLFDQL